MLTGEDTFITWRHLKGAFSLNGNAKIISANDSVNFTYGGRFAEPEEAASVGCLPPQRAQCPQVAHQHAGDDSWS